MKIIHTGDIHIGSAFRYLPTKKAQQRKSEILSGFSRLCAYAKSENVGAVLIAGDLFDSQEISRGELRACMQAIASANPVPFFYAQGNHDYAFDFSGESPENFIFFKREWQSYALGENIVITGKNTDYAEEFIPPILNADDFNILLLHGDIARDIPLGTLKNRGVDYLALGHIHVPMLRAERLDERGKYRYCGCLESRGFDEIGERGFFLLKVQNKRIVSEEFLSFSTRKTLEISLDIGGCVSYSALEKIAWNAIENAGKENLLKLVFCGACSQEMQGYLPTLFSRIENGAFFVKAEDKTKPVVDYERLKTEKTERGAFIREATVYEMNEEFRREVIEIGLRALAGEEIEL